jgi:hypothetical protein
MRWRKIKPEAQLNREANLSSLRQMKKQLLNSFLNENAMSPSTIWVYQALVSLNRLYLTSAIGVKIYQTLWEDIGIILTTLPRTEVTRPTLPGSLILYINSRTIVSSLNSLSSTWTKRKQSLLNNLRKFNHLVERRRDLRKYLLLIMIIPQARLSLWLRSGLKN